MRASRTTAARRRVGIVDAARPVATRADGVRIRTLAVRRRGVARRMRARPTRPSTPAPGRGPSLSRRRQAIEAWTTMIPMTQHQLLVVTMAAQLRIGVTFITGRE